MLEDITYVMQYLKQSAHIVKNFHCLSLSFYEGAYARALIYSPIEEVDWKPNSFYDMTLLEAVFRAL